MNKQYELYHHYRQGGLTLEEASLAVSYNRDALILNSAEGTLIGAFAFTCTSEGFDFWWEIIERIKTK